MFYTFLQLLCVDEQRWMKNNHNNKCFMEYSNNEL